MAKIDLIRKTDQAWLLDPKEEFKRKSIEFEVRKDPLTGHVSRILPYRRKLPETKIQQEVLETSKHGCPFCPDQIQSSTPKFVPEITSEGRMREGRAWLFPNALPYSRYNWVVILSEDHFLHLDQFSVELLRDGFLVAQKGISRVERSQPEFKYSSINWNYLPQAGGAIYHPHLQVVIERAPTASHRTVLDGLKRYQKGKGSFFWKDFLSEEKKKGGRYIGCEGKVHFLSAFSPRAIWGEILILFYNRSTFNDIRREDWSHLSQGLTKIFQYLKKYTLSFNFSLFSGETKGIRSWVYARLCPRLVIPPWNTSDVNYFEKLHEEVMCVVSPEELTKEIKTFFKD